MLPLLERTHSQHPNTAQYSVSNRQGHNYGSFHTSESKDTFILCDVPKMVIICTNVEKERTEGKELRSRVNERAILCVLKGGFKFRIFLERNEVGLQPLCSLQNIVSLSENAATAAPVLPPTPLNIIRCWLILTDHCKVFWVTQCAIFQRKVTVFDTNVG